MEHVGPRKRRDGRKHVRGRARKPLRHDASVRQPGGVDALEIDAAILRGLGHHRSYESLVVDVLILGGLAATLQYRTTGRTAVPRVGDPLGIGHDEPDRVALLAPPGPADLVR